MAVCRVQCRLHSVHDTEDDLVNTFHFEGTPSNDPENVTDMLSDFYDDLSSWLSDDSLTDEVDIKMYNLEDDEPRAPFWSVEHNIPSLSSAGALLPQASIVMSWQAEKVSGVNQARRRNRVYLGGFTATSVAATGRVNGATLTAVVTAGQNLLDAAAASINWQWVVYSPTTAAAGAGPADGFFSIDNGWVDNGVDIQRRRKWDPTDRETFS